MYTEAKINFLKEDADFPEWLGDVTGALQARACVVAALTRALPGGTCAAGKPDLREMTLEEHGKSYSKLKRKGGIKSKNLGASMVVFAVGFVSYCTHSLAHLSK